jgi:uncharacterized membrane-anchored protein YhcB (DUF1043 family)
MKTFGLICAVIGIIAAIFVGTVLMRSCNTAKKMADQTILNASGNVSSYEQFLKKYNQYKQYQDQFVEADKKVSELEKAGDKISQRYCNLVTESDGVRNMMARIAADYNAMSQNCYQAIWKTKGLPEHLGN